MVGAWPKGKEDSAKQTFSFLKKVMLAKDESTFSARGPLNLTDGDWEYKYSQEGDIEEFNGYEEIYYQGKLVFFHRIIGGLINN